MLNGGLLVFIAFLLVIAGAFYIHLRWRRAPQAYRAMIALALGYFIAGAVAGPGWRSAPLRGLPRLSRPVRGTDGGAGVGISWCLFAEWVHRQGGEGD
jgi:hypothetical protein